MRKKRILMVNESSCLATGYSTYGREVQQRLFDTDKYEIAELACYANAEEKRAFDFPWKIYPNVPLGERKLNEYKTLISNQFGEYSFNDVCLDFKPDIVWCIRDTWMDEHIERSPFRRLFNWCIMPTVDSTPQQEQWIATFMNADAVLSYSDWGLERLKVEGGGLIKTHRAAPPGADIDVFRPLNKGRARDILHMEQGVYVVGTIMRNQSRKLYPNLIDAFKLYLKSVPPEISKKSYLYLHTSFPDRGWDIPNLIKRSGISHKILITYKCKRNECAAVTPAFYQDARGICPRCHHNSLAIVNVEHGVDSHTLALILNTFDAYAQYANSEGFGMPQVEAAACGIPVFATDYSAMADVVRKVNGFPIPVQRYMVDPDFGTNRAIPDDKAFAQLLRDFFTKTPEYREQKSREARRGVETHYRWEKTTEVWMEVFDKMPHRNEWDSAPHIHTPLPLPSELPTNDALVKWAIANYLGRPDLVNSYMAMRLIRDLNWGTKFDTTGASYQNENTMVGRNVVAYFTQDDMFKELDRIRESNNMWEMKRCPIR